MPANLPFTIDALRTAYASGMCPETVVEEVYRRIETVDDPAIFINLQSKDRVLAAARALGAPDPARPLWGVPFVIKDNIDAEGLPTTAACPAYEYVARQDAFVVARLKEAGALLIGKTNLDQFATGLVGVRSPYGVPRNSIDPEIVPGGSSSGSAVAVGHGVVAFSLGTDTAGSGRVPAALNNIVGLKPTLGALSAGGVVPACRTLDTISIFAQTVADAHLVLSAAAAFDKDDAFSRRFGEMPLGPVPVRPRIGIPDANSARFFGDAAQARMFEAAVATLSDAGAEVVALDFTPFYDVAEMLYEGAWVAERHTVIADLLAQDPEAIHPVTRQVVRAAEDLSAADAFRGIYRLRELARVAETAMAGLDALCVPTIPTFYSLDDLAADPIGPNSRLGTYTNFVNLLDMSGIAVPTRPRQDGRPGSVTLLGGAGADGKLASLAQVFEQQGGRTLGATSHPVPAPSRAPVAAAADEIEIAVCGAHMSGLPLNGELTGRGARFLSRALTAPGYRLYALAGGPPARPGLLRIEKGRAIEVETWGLPRAALAEFMDGIPAPLSIGTIRLQDGRQVKGFLVESSGVQGARDITDFGGWRAFVDAQLIPGG